jgi:hypothetical protein
MIREEATGQLADGRDGLHAILRSEVRLRAAEAGGSARRGGVSGTNSVTTEEAQVAGWRRLTDADLLACDLNDA